MSGSVKLASGVSNTQSASLFTEAKNHHNKKKIYLKNGTKNADTKLKRSVGGGGGGGGGWLEDRNTDSNGHIDKDRQVNIQTDP